MGHSVRKQTSEFKRIAKQARMLYRIGGHWTWATIADELGIIGKDGKPSPGLMYKIAVEDYMPGLEVCKRLKIGKLYCPTCGQQIRTKKPNYVKEAVKFLRLKELENETKIKDS